MNAGTDPGSLTFLEAGGFEGFLPQGALHAEGCLSIPNECGVYAMIRESLVPGEFMPRSTAPEYRGMKPHLPIDDLKARWVPGAQLLYLGCAFGTGVRSLLRQRVKRYLRFGHGKVVGHWGGRLVWQLRDHAKLLVAWKSTGDTDPRALTADLLDRFVARYGELPFANDRDAHDVDDSQGDS